MGYAVSDFICILSRLPNLRVDHPQSMKVSAIKDNISSPNHRRDVCSELFRKKVTLEHAEMVMCHSEYGQWKLHTSAMSWGEADQHCGMKAKGNDYLNNRLILLSYKRWYLISTRVSDIFVLTQRQINSWIIPAFVVFLDTKLWS